VALPGAGGTGSNLKEEQRSLGFPSLRDALTNGDFAISIQIEMSLFHQDVWIGAAANAKVVVESGEEGEEATAAEEAAIIALAGTRGRKTCGQFSPGGACRELPEDAIEEAARGCPRAARLPALSRISWASASTSQDNVAILAERVTEGLVRAARVHDVAIFLDGDEGGKLAGDLLGEAPAVEGDDGGRVAVLIFGFRIRGKERLEDGPLFIGEEGIWCVFFRNEGKQIVDGGRGAPWRTSWENTAGRAPALRRTMCPSGGARGWTSWENTRTLCQSSRAEGRGVLCSFFGNGENQFGAGKGKEERRKRRGGGGRRLEGIGVAGDAASLEARADEAEGRAGNFQEALLGDS